MTRDELQELYARRLKYILFAGYALIMLYLLFIRNRSSVVTDYWTQIRASSNFVPGHTIKIWFWVLKNSEDAALIRFSIRNLAGNVLLFIPLGFFLPQLLKCCRQFVITLAVSAGIIAAVELLQLFTLRGSCDIDDLILNLAGTAAGYGIYRLLPKPGYSRQ